MKKHRPYGPAPMKWEVDLLKLRAFEMVLVLFYIEDLKQFILNSLKFTNELAGILLPAKGQPICGGQSEESKREGKRFELARQSLVTRGVISQTESDELLELVDYRNTVAHEVQQLTVDIGAYSHLTKFYSATFEPIPQYDYSAAKRAKQIREKISQGMAAKNYVLPASFRSLQFDAAERTYITEIERLRKTVNKGIDQVNKIIAGTSEVIASIPEETLNSAQPGHPRNTKANGTLSKQGELCVFKLYEAKATPLAVAHLMRISHGAASRWFKKWLLMSSKGSSHL